MPNPLLSKSAFKTGLSCPRKLAYQRESYPSQADANPYMEFLADGGFMVEAIARALYPDGCEVSAASNEPPAEATRRLLNAADRVDLFEPVFEHEGCMVRVDILSKRGDTIDLIEIKAKSFDSQEDGASPFRGKRGGISSDWLEYLQDLAFQTAVVRGALGRGVKVVPRLCVVDKAKTCNDDSIFTKINLIPRPDREFGLPSATYTGNPADIAKQHFLAFLDATDEVAELLADAGSEGVGATRDRLVNAIRSGTLRDLPIVLGVECKKCEYRGAATADSPKDGFRECWGTLGDGDPHLLDLFRVDLLGGKGGRAVPELLRKGICTVRDIPLDVIASESSTGMRQRAQVASVRSGKEWRGEGLATALAAIKPPLHFVDFETSRMAVPYHAGMHPYEQIAFQFSCHTLASPDASDLAHRDWINLDDRWPNVEFAQALRDAIGDTGLMLTWSDHEKSALKEIREQILTYGKGPKDLADWLGPLTIAHGEGGRIVDLYDICRLNYLHPSMGGKTSVKAVLKAIWEGNDALHDHPWFADYLCRKDGKVLSPYEALEATDVGGGQSVVVRDGTGAMRAYQDMVYGLRRGDAAYRDACKGSLLRYCKLDTLAMVMVWVHWTGGIP
jgi:hypothetical protein